MLVVDVVLVVLEVVDVGAGPVDTMIVTVEPSSTSVPTGGWVPTTLPSGTVAEDSLR